MQVVHKDRILSGSKSSIFDENKIKFDKDVNFVEIIEILCNQCCFHQLVNPLTFNGFQAG